MKQFLLAFVFCISLQAQTKVDILGQTIGAVAGQPAEKVREEGQWCPIPVFRKTSETQLQVFPTIGPDDKCYLHFGPVPLTVKEYTTKVTVTVTGGGDDLVMMYWKLQDVNPKLYISATTTSNFTCEGCTIEERQTRAFPKGSIFLGMYGVVAGKWESSGYPIIDHQQIGIAEGTGALIEYNPGAGYIFQLQDLPKSPVLLQQEAQLKQAQVDLEVSRTQTLVRTMEENSQPQNQILQLTQEIENLKKTQLSLETQLSLKTPVILQDPDSSGLRKKLENAQADMEQVTKQVREIVQVNIDRSLELFATQYQTLVEKVKEESTRYRVQPPKNSKEKCKDNEWSSDSKFKYECVNNTWQRYALDQTWK